MGEQRSPTCIEKGHLVCMKHHQIVIVTDEFDPHTDAIMVLLRQMGHDPIRIHPADIPLKAEALAYYNGSSWQGQIATRKRTLILDEIRSIWWRRPGSPTLLPTLSAEEEPFASVEVDHVLKGMWHGLEQKCYWMSFPPAIRKASYKLSQLQQATILGFQVPRTLVTTDPERIRQFYEACDEAIIYKTFSNPQPDPKTPRGIYTTPIHEEQLARLDTIRTAPGLFQEYIPKQVELRVTVIGDELFTAEIHSQVHQRTRHDWRHYDVVTPMQQHPLPVDLAEKCLALTRWYGLNFSASDLILTPDGRYVFLEMNPNGQWLWIQEQVPELHMKEALVACLIRGSNA